MLTVAAVPSLASATQSLNSVSVASPASNGVLALDVSGASTVPGAPVIQWLRNGGSNQRWNFVALSNGYEQIVNQNSGQCLTSDGVAGHWVYQWPCDNSNPHQQWEGDLGSVWSSMNGLQNRASALWLDVAGDAYWPGAHLITWYWNATLGEAFGIQ
jgi:hypothetical protein